jgi:hypothetical protein
MRTPYAAFALLLGSSLWAGFGCSSTTEDIGDESGAAASSNCSIIDQQTGRPIDPAKFDKLNDPIAKKILEGNNCPTSFNAVLAKLKDTDKDGCNGGNDGLQSFLINETVAFKSQDEASRAAFRTVTSKACNGRDQTKMLFSSFATQAGQAQDGVEMIGKDDTTGVFNYYELVEGNQWVFFGTSEDFIGNGYNCGKDTGFCISNNSSKQSNASGKSCSSCHVSGGLIMKELSSPWLHWTAGFANGSQAVVSKNPGLGRQDQGENLEFNVVRKSFGDYNKARVKILAKRGVQELLRPLFCTMDINLTSGLGSSDLFADRAFAGGFLSVDSTVYNKLKTDPRVRQTVIGTDKDDTASPFTFPSKGQIDNQYLEALKTAGFIDDEFIKDVLRVDFTRPIFSPARCALVDVVASTKNNEGVDDKVRAFGNDPNATNAQLQLPIAALYKNTLAAKGSRTPAEDLLLKNLSDATLNAAAHQAAAQAFFQACTTRLNGAEKEQAVLDVMTWASHQRKVMRDNVRGNNGQRLLEPGPAGDNKMATDSIAFNPNAFDPTTCKLDLPPNQVK